jgi:hypothetical protein
MRVLLLATGLPFWAMAMVAFSKFLQTRDQRWDRYYYGLMTVAFILWGIGHIMAHEYLWSALDGLIVLWMVYQWHHRGGGHGLKRKLKALSEEGKTKLAQLAEAVKPRLAPSPG